MASETPFDPGRYDDLEKLILDLNFGDLLRINFRNFKYGNYEFPLQLRNYKLEGFQRIIVAEENLPRDIKFMDNDKNSKRCRQDYIYYDSFVGSIVGVLLGIFHPTSGREEGHVIVDNFGNVYVTKDSLWLSLGMSLPRTEKQVDEAFSAVHLLPRLIIDVNCMSSYEIIKDNYLENIRKDKEDDYPEVHISLTDRFDLEQRIKIYERKFEHRTKQIKSKRKPRN